MRPSLLYRFAIVKIDGRGMIDSRPDAKDIPGRPDKSKKSVSRKATKPQRKEKRMFNFVGRAFELELHVNIDRF